MTVLIKERMTHRHTQKEGDVKTQEKGPSTGQVSEEMNPANTFISDF